MTAKKKKMVKGLVVVALIAIIGIGATLAYFSYNTGKKTNNFTSSQDLKGTTEETTWKETSGSDYYPGKVISKNPTINITGTEAGWVAAKVDYWANATKDSDGNVSGGTQVDKDTFAKYGTMNWNVGTAAGDWTLIAKNNAGGQLYMYNSTVSKDSTYSYVDAADSKTVTGNGANPLFTDVTINAQMKTLESSKIGTTTVYTFTDVDKDGKYTAGIDKDLKAVEDKSVVTSTSTTNYVDVDGNTLAIDSLPSFVIDINGYAVQSEGIDNTTAAAQLIAMANKGLATTDAGYFTAV